MRESVFAHGNCVAIDYKMWYLNPIKLSAEVAQLASRYKWGKVILMVEVKYETTEKQME